MAVGNLSNPRRSIRGLGMANVRSFVLAATAAWAYSRKSGGPVWLNDRRMTPKRCPDAPPGVASLNKKRSLIRGKSCIHRDTLDRGHHPAFPWSGVGGGRNRTCTYQDDNSSMKTL